MLAPKLSLVEADIAPMCGPGGEQEPDSPGITVRNLRIHIAYYSGFGGDSRT
jgi:hypothetical protein